MEKRSSMAKVKRAALELTAKRLFLRQAELVVWLV